MPASRVRVRLPHSHGGLLALAAVLGAVMAAPLVAWQFGGARLITKFPGLPEFTYAVLMIGLLAIPAVAVVVWIVRQCQHPRWVAAAGAVYGFTLMLFVNFAHVLSEPTTLYPVDMEDPAGVLAATIVIAAAALLALLVQRAVSYRIIEQDGTLCDRCGYPAGRSLSSVCPECGHECDPRAMVLSDRLIASVARRRRRVFAALGVIVGLGFALAAWSERDYRTLGRSFGDGAQAWTQTPWMQAYRAVDGDPHETVVYVQLERRPAWKPHAIRISFGHLVVRQQDAMAVIGTGEPHITMVVPVSASRRVLRSGPSQEMIQRLRDAAEAADWQPAQWWHEANRTVQTPWIEPQ